MRHPVHDESAAVDHESAAVDHESAAVHDESAAVHDEPATVVQLRAGVLVDSAAVDELCADVQFCAGVRLVIERVVWLGACGRTEQLTVRARTWPDR
jgi:hypothetical protein